MVNSSNFKSYLLRNGRKLNTAYPNDVKAVSRTFYNDPDHIYNNYNTIDLNEILNRIIREPERRIELAAGGQGGEIKPYQSAIRAFMEYVNNIKQNNK